MNKQSFSSNKHLDISKAFLRISIILPVYNESENIEEQIKQIEEAVKIDHEILIIYDFDDDNTIDTVKKLQKRYSSLRLVKNIIGPGLINAIKTGLEKCHGELVVVMPADLSDRPKTINKMYQKIIDGCDIVCATRYAKGGKKIGGGILKTSLSRLAGLSTPLLLGISTTDIANGFKMYRKEVLKNIKIESTGGWEFSMEIVVKANCLGFKICEVPTVWRDRISGKSKFKLLKWLPKYIRWYLLGILLRLNIYRLVF